jgi:cytochrome c peroxidase
MRVVAPIFLLLAVVGVLGVACEATHMKDDAVLWGRATDYFEPLPEQALNPDNPMTAAKVELGRKLYFDTRLSRNETISCNSCHDLASFGVDGLPTSPGDEGQLGGRNSPTVLNAALHASQFWDGRAEDVEQQAGMPITNPVEMAIPSEAFLVERLSGVEDYPALFAESFPGEEQPLSYENIRLALAAFERTLLTPAPIDDYLRGDASALDRQQLDGMSLFLDLGCASCHNGVNFGAASFRKFGLNDDYWVHTNSDPVDEGRLQLTGEEEDRYVFRVASLRNVAETGPYFHDGSVAELEEALRVMVQLQVGMELEPNQLENLTAFLQSLSGELEGDVLGG